jgi:DNA invertase Pin-like site-specific DNA recombinase
MKPQKQEILDYVGQQRQEGRSVSEIIKGLELSRASYYRWVDEDGKNHRLLKSGIHRCVV